MNTQPASDDTLDPTQALLDMLDLQNEGGVRTLEDIFVGRTISPARGSVYGGQVMAQALTAAMRTVENERVVHSMHGYFLRAGNIHEPITFGVERMRDGRSFSTRRVHAYQFGKPILSSIFSFQAPSVGLEHHDECPPGMPDPESLPTPQDLVGHLDLPQARAILQRPFDLRYITPAIYLDPDHDHTPFNAVWVRTHKLLPDDPRIHQAALAYVSDYVMLEPTLRRHGKAWTEQGMNIASLDHAMWWHRPARADDWLLYIQESPSASGARALGSGRMFNRDGHLVATVMQEGMIRLPEFRDPDEP
ncbi:MAG: acyl-CoA thioesterase II [Kocuria sp.]|nr:acyl-CoA thioesterase II [Kocuria sp.]